MQCRFFFVFAVALLSVRSLAVLAKGKDDKETEKLHMKVTSMSDDIKQIQATDGTRYLLTVYQISTTDVNCYTDKHTNVAMAGERNESAVDADISSIISGLLNDSDAVSKEVDTGKVMKLFLDCSNSPKDAVQTLANLTNTPAPPHHRVAMKKRAWWSSGWAIYPGTKWCGSGGSAINYDDLGTYDLLDECCRTHAHCDTSISPSKYKYGKFNWYIWTISLCDCDDTFKQCMRNVTRGPQKGAAQTVDFIYFRLLGIKCFTLNDKGKAVMRS
ncbi:uncharacterized protein [Littorina saxatilis]|uniref:Phospholipase A2-like central domain-containing protein n=1 Tax=Littorina saxatilis TaxID=31220 RepID=A0AAN9G7L9_9CAEN